MSEEGYVGMDGYIPKVRREMVRDSARRGLDWEGPNQIQGGEGSMKEKGHGGIEC